MEKPTIYHATARSIDGNILRPGFGHTAAYDTYKAGPEQEAQKGRFVFAGASLPMAYSYALKLNIPYPITLDGKTSFHNDSHMQSMGIYNGIPITVFRDGEKFETELQNAHPTIYEIPKENNFYESKTSKGTPTGEWVSREPVNIEHAKTIPVNGVNDAMAHGVQVFYAKNATQWYSLKNDARRKIIADVERIYGEDDNQRCEYECNIRFLTFVGECIKNGTLRHINRERDINPFDFDALASKEKRWAITPIGNAAGKGQATVSF